MSRLLEVRGLRYAYPDGTQALAGVDFGLDARECVAMLGANGSGKSTFALCVCGLLRGEGAVSVNGRTGLVFQDPDEQLFMPTVLDDVAFGPRNRGLERKAALERAHIELERVGMAHAASKAPYHLSAGEKRRVAIAGVLAMDPDILVLDEPTTFLDPPAQRALLHLLVELPQAKLIITHDTRFAETLATRAVFFQSGRIVAEGTPAEIIRRFDWTPR